MTASWTVGSSYAIDVKLTVDEAKQAMTAGREPMGKALAAKDEKIYQEEVKKILQQASLKSRVGASPEKDPCGASAILRTKRYRLEAIGREEATKSKQQNMNVRAPEELVKKTIDMPNMEIEVQICGDDEYFADGVKVAFQQGSKTIEPISVSQADRGRKIEIQGKGPAYRTRFTAMFAYDSFDPNAKTKIAIYFPDGKMVDFDADFSKVK
jgi:flagellar motor protein MotB